MPPRRRAPAWTVLLSGLCLTACDTLTEVRVVRQEIPASLLRCRPRPVVPVLSTDADLALWIEDEISAGEDCRSRLARVRELVEPAE